MPPQLTDEQRLALQSRPDGPVRVVDPQSSETYVLLRANVYERLRVLFEDVEADISETYPAQMEAALRAGWNDPLMDEYNDYDSHRLPVP